MEEATKLFPRRREAVFLLVGIGGFWGGIASLMLVSLLFGRRTTSPWAFLLVVLTFGSVFLLQQGVRRVALSKTGEAPAAWPRGPGVGAQMDAIAPGTLAAAARRLGLPGALVATVLYLMLLADAGLLVVLSSHNS